MKLTKSKLKQIIKEELTHVLQTEGFFSSVGKAFGLGKEKVDINSIFKSVQDHGAELISVWTNPDLLQKYDKAYANSVSSDLGQRQKNLSKPVPTVLTKHAVPFLSVQREFSEMIDKHIKTLGDAKIDEAFFTSAVAGKALGQSAKGGKGNIFHDERPRQQQDSPRPTTLTPERKEAINSLLKIKNILRYTAKSIADPRSLNLDREGPSVMIQRKTNEIKELLAGLTAKGEGGLS